MSSPISTCSNIDTALFQRPDMECLNSRTRHARAALPAVSTARRANARRAGLAAEEAARILRALEKRRDAAVQPVGLPLVDDASEDHPKVGTARTGAMGRRHAAEFAGTPRRDDRPDEDANRPISVVGRRGAPTQGKTLAVMQASAACSRSTR